MRGFSPLGFIGCNTVIIGIGLIPEAVVSKVLPGEWTGRMNTGAEGAITGEL
jgi:hypothetical protein